jgi:hypothetical protein
MRETTINLAHNNMAMPITAHSRPNRFRSDVN